MIRKTALVFVCVSSFYSCLFLILYGVHPVVASALTGLIGSFICLGKKVPRSEIGSLSYCSSFAAIGVQELSQNFFYLTCIPLIIMITYEVVKNKFIGIGGKLGAIAFISTGFCVLILKVL